VDRPEVRNLLQQNEAVALVQQWARFLVDIDARVAPLMHVLEVAADTDPAGRKLHQQLLDQRLEGARIVVNRVVDLVR
jgi:hypothetical protein